MRILQHICPPRVIRISHANMHLPSGEPNIAGAHQRRLHILAPRTGIY
jgi:hypothetical protein